MGVEVSTVNSVGNSFTDGLKTAYNWLGENQWAGGLSLVALQFGIVPLVDVLAKKVFGRAFGPDEHEYEKSNARLYTEKAISVVLIAGLTALLGAALALPWTIIAIIALASIAFYAFFKFSHNTLTPDEKLGLIAKDREQVQAKFDANAVEVQQLDVIREDQINAAKTLIERANDGLKALMDAAVLANTNHLADANADRTQDGAFAQRATDATNNYNTAVTNLTTLEANFATQKKAIEEKTAEGAVLDARLKHLDKVKERIEKEKPPVV